MTHRRSFKLSLCQFAQNTKDGEGALAACAFAEGKAA
jgi:hypothetical protein